MYFVGNEFDPDAGSYKALQNAIKAAGKRKMKVFDSDGTVVWPKAAEQLPEPEETPEEPQTEAAPEAEQPALEETPEEILEVESTAAQQPAPTKHIIGRVEVVRQGLLAVRNAPSWEDGHKNGIVKTGHTVEITECKIIDGKKLYHAVDGYWISGEKEDTKLLEE